MDSITLVRCPFSHTCPPRVMRLMREHGLTVRPGRRFVATTDSDHDGPIFPNLAKDVVPTGPNQLWVADITYIAITVGFV
jgi:putative transposase